MKLRSGLWAIVALLSGCCLNPQTYDAEVKQQVSVGMSTEAAIDTLTHSHFQCYAPTLPSEGKPPAIDCRDVQSWALWKLCSCSPGLWLTLSPDGKTVTKITTSPTCWGYALG
jgi:hypothetical protein